MSNERHTARFVLYAEGLLFCILGVLAMVLPMVTTTTIDRILALFLLGAGAFGVLRNLVGQGLPPAPWHTLAALTMLGFGGLLLAFPATGTLTLTVGFSGMFMIFGVLQLLEGFRYSGIPGRGWMFLQSMLSLSMAFVLWLKWPQVAVPFISFLVGLNLLIFGIVLILLGRGIHKTAGINLE